MALQDLAILAGLVRIDEEQGDMASHVVEPLLRLHPPGDL